MGSLQKLCKAFDGGASTWRLKGGQYYRPGIAVMFWENVPYISDVYSQRPDVWPGQILNHGLVVQSVASDIDNESTSLEIQ